MLISMRVPIPQLLCVERRSHHQQLPVWYSVSCLGQVREHMSSYSHTFLLTRVTYSHTGKLGAVFGYLILQIACDVKVEYFITSHQRVNLFVLSAVLCVLACLATYAVVVRRADKTLQRKWKHLRMIKIFIDFYLSKIGPHQELICYLK